MTCWSAQQYNSTSSSASAVDDERCGLSGIGLILGAGLAILREFLRTPIESLLQRSVIDNSSQAYNRDYLIQRMEETVAQSDTAGLLLGLVRLDGFETFIELMPQSISQQVIRQVVQTMKN